MECHTRDVIFILDTARPLLSLVLSFKHIELQPPAMLPPNFALSACLLAIQIHTVLATELQVRQNNTAAIPRFNPLASDNVAVYFGHSPNNRNASLETLCSTPSIDIIILGFVTAFNGSDKLPLYKLTSTCSSRSRKGMCPELAAHIQNCQSLGKKVFISIGGSASNASFSSQQEAINAANTMWDLFGAGSGPLSLRPFGNVAVDGFDIGKLETYHRVSPQIY